MKFRFTLLVLCSAIGWSCIKDPVPIPDTSYNLRADSLRVMTTDMPYDKYNDAVFVNSTTGYAVSDNGRIVKTTDGGYHWTTLSSGVNFLLKKIRFVNSQAGFVIGGDSTGGYLLKTSDAGLNWQKINLHLPEPGWPTGLFFLDPDRGFITGKKYFKKTVDGGLTWTDAAGPVTENFGDISFRTYQLGYATAANGRYFITMDGGSSWEAVQSDKSQALGEICYSPSRSFAVSGTDLVDLSTGKTSAGGKLPTGATRILFLNDRNAVAAGQHFETGFWPYGDIFLTNSSWTDYLQKKYSPQSEALNFSAIVRTAEKRVLFIGQSLLNPIIVELNY